MQNKLEVKCIKLRRDKRGVELAINFLVMVMIALVIFGFGIRFAYKLFSSSSDLTEDAYDKYASQIADLSCAGAEKICLPTKTKTLEGDKAGMFGLVIENVFGEEKTFHIEVTPKLFVARGESVGEEFDEDAGINWLPHETDEVLQAKEKQTVGILVSGGDAEPGTYAFEVRVGYNDDTGETVSYNNGIPFKLYVKVA